MSRFRLVCRSYQTWAKIVGFLEAGLNSAAFIFFLYQAISLAVNSSDRRTFNFKHPEFLKMFKDQLNDDQKFHEFRNAIQNDEFHEFLQNKLMEEPEFQNFLFWDTIFQVVIWSFTAIIFFAVVFSVFLIRGAYTKNLFMLRCWLIFELVVLVISLPLNGFEIYLEEKRKMMTIVSTISYKFLDVIAIFIVYQFMREIRAESGKEDNDKTVFRENQSTTNNSNGNYVEFQNEI